MTASPSFKGVLYAEQASVSSLRPAFWNITPQIPPPAHNPLFAALVFDEDAQDWRIEQKDVEYEFDYPDTASSDNE